jgi:hypothetical protein
MGLFAAWYAGEKSVHRHRNSGAAMARGLANSSGAVGRTDARLRAYGFVLYSRPTSVRARWGSVLACCEVAIAVAIYLEIAAYFHSHRHLWISVCVAPLLLLRSGQSIAFGVTSFKGHLERGGRWGRMRTGEALRTWKFWGLVGFAALAFAASSYVLALLWLSHHEGWPQFWLAAIVGWLSFNMGIAVMTAGCRPAIGGPFAVVGSIVSPAAIGLAIYVSGAGATAVGGAMVAAAAIAATSATIAIGEIATREGVRVALRVSWFVGLALVAVGATAAITTGGLAAVLAILVVGASIISLICRLLIAAFEEFGLIKDEVELARFGRVAKLAFTVICLFGALVGDVLRAVFTRFWATIRHLPAGWRALPTNWSRTLFSTDCAHPPELVPGYTGQDSFNFTWMYEQYRSKREFDDVWLLNSIQIVSYFLPAYLYRLSIKSTFWLYWPLAYIANGAADETRPAVLFDRLAATPYGWFSALVAAVSLGAFVVLNAHIAQLWPSLHVALQVAAVEFLFQLDYASQKPWVLLGLASSVIALVLFLWAGYLRPEFKHGAIDNKQMAAMLRHAARMKQLARAGRVCTILTILSLLVYYLLWRSPLQCVLQDHNFYHTLGLLRRYYGVHMPVGPPCGIFI